jgi:hypothetical protein
MPTTSAPFDGQSRFGGIPCAPRHLNKYIRSEPLLKCRYVGAVVETRVAHKKKEVDNSAIIRIGGTDRGGSGMLAEKAEKLINTYSVEYYAPEDDGDEKSINGDEESPNDKANPTHRRREMSRITSQEDILAGFILQSRRLSNRQFTCSHRSAWKKRVRLRWERFIS